MLGLRNVRSLLYVHKPFRKPQAIGATKGEGMTSAPRIHKMVQQTAAEGLLLIRKDGDQVGRPWEVQDPQGLK